MPPLVSIALASYNGAKFIAHQLSTILNQTIDDIEIVVSDDISTDGTIDIIKSFLPNTRIRLVPNNERLGVIKNFENALKNCTGQYIAFADQDDVWLPDKLEKSLGLLRQLEIKYGAETPCMVFSDLTIVNEDISKIGDCYIKTNGLNPHHTALSNLLVENVATGCTIIANRALIDLVPTFPQGIFMHDMFLAMTASCFGQMGYLDESTLLYRQHENNTLGHSKNPLSKVLSNTSSTLLNKETKAAFLEKEIAQARAFFQMFHSKLNKQQNELLEGFISIKKRSKFSRINYLLTNKITKGTLLKTINLLIKI